MSHSTVKIEVRIFISETYRDRNWEENTNYLLADPKAYGVSQITYAYTEAQLRRQVRGIPCTVTAFVKILGQPGVNEHEAMHTTVLETAVNWIYNP